MSSHSYFGDGLSTHNYSYYKRDESLAVARSAEDDEKGRMFVLAKELHEASRLINSPEPVGLADIAFFLDQKDRNESISGLMTASKELETSGRDCGVIASKFVGAMAIDAGLFGGLPITSSLVSIYDVTARFLKSTK